MNDVICAYKGRDNLALTVFVPNICDNNCSFCTSKRDYFLHRPNIELIKKTYLEIISSSFFENFVSDVVFTGGEPTNNLEMLDWFLTHINRFNKKVFINTTMPQSNYKKFLSWTKKSPYSVMIRGISVSRHTTSYEEDCRQLLYPANDLDLLNFMKETLIPIRINCVVSAQENKEKINSLLNRWQYPFVLNLREDYTQMTEHELHNPYSQNLITLSQLGCSYLEKTSCRVCDTTTFQANDNLSIVLYHKGLERTFITDKNDNKRYYHDIVLFQDGEAFLDWDRKHSFSGKLDTLPSCSFSPEKFTADKDDCTSAILKQPIQHHHFPEYEIQSYEQDRYICGYHSGRSGC